ncbi:MAG TPA: hypothetical protein VFF16_05190 [Telluria sp.]|nr:hypothetical protein [Telluria sp.]
MTTTIYDKTEKGREEIATRKYQLPPRLRTLLVMIDGRNSLETVLKNIAGLGLNGESVNLLVANEYIRLVSGGPEAANEPAPPRAAAPRKREADPEAAARMADLTAKAVEEAEQFRAVYEFYTQTIKSTLGLRGFMLQMKVEKAATVGELRELRHAYLDAVLKAKGSEIARSLRDRLDGLLGGAPETDDFALAS